MARVRSIVKGREKDEEGTRPLIRTPPAGVAARPRAVQIPLPGTGMVLRGRPQFHVRKAQGSVDASCALDRPRL